MRTVAFTRLRMPLLSLLACAAVLGWAAAVHALSGQYQGGSVTSAGHPSHKAAADTGGLVAWYPLDGNVNDYSGNVYNATPTNFTGTPTDGYVAGKYGQGLLLNGSNGYAGVPNFTFPNSGAALSVSLWFKPDSAFNTGKHDELLTQDSGLVEFYTGDGTTICMYVNGSKVLAGAYEVHALGGRRSGPWSRASTSSRHSRKNWPGKKQAWRRRRTSGQCFCRCWWSVWR